MKRELATESQDLPHVATEDAEICDCGRHRDDALHNLGVNLQQIASNQLTLQTEKGV